MAALPLFQVTDAVPVPARSRFRQTIKTTRFDGAVGVQSFVDLNPESLDADLPIHRISDRRVYDVAVIGAGPAGLRLAEDVSRHGVRVCCIDPSPASMWPNNYGVWVDEFEEVGMVDCLDHTWPAAAVIIDDGERKRLERPYGRVCRRSLKGKLMRGCVSQGVRFHQAAALGVVEEEEFISAVRCSDGSEVKTNLVVDASGFCSRFLEYDKPRDHGYQVAHGILAEVRDHPFELDEMVLMDWRDSHTRNEPGLHERNQKHPTFLYAMPLGRNLIFLEETSLVSRRPPLQCSEMKRRLFCRLRQLGIDVKRVLEEERCRIPMGGPLPRMPQRAVGIGGAAGFVHPSTGYMLAAALAAIPSLTGAIVEGVGSGQLDRRAWGRVWPRERRWAREFYCFGMETLLKLDLRGMRGFFTAFFDLEPDEWAGFLSSRLSFLQLHALSLSLFARAACLTKLDLLTNSPAPFAHMIATLLSG